MLIVASQIDIAVASPDNRSTIRSAYVVTKQIPPPKDEGNTGMNAR